MTSVALCFQAFSSLRFGSLSTEAKAPSSRSTPKGVRKLSLGTVFAKLFQGFLILSDPSADIA